MLELDALFRIEVEHSQCMSAIRTQLKTNNANLTTGDYIPLVDTWCGTKQKNGTKELYLGCQTTIKFDLSTAWLICI